MAFFGHFDPYKADRDKAAYLRGLEAKVARDRIKAYAIRDRDERSFSSAKLRKSPITLPTIAFSKPKP